MFTKFVSRNHWFQLSTLFFGKICSIANISKCRKQWFCVIRATKSKYNKIKTCWRHANVLKGALLHTQLYDFFKS